MKIVQKWNQIKNQFFILSKPNLEIIHQFWGWDQICGEYVGGGREKGLQLKEYHFVLISKIPTLEQK